jgi:hypothetical protein
MYPLDHHCVIAPRIFLAVALSYSLGACGGDGSGPAAPVDVTGDWIGTIQSSQVPAPGTEIDLTLSQTGTTGTGTYFVPASGAFGDIDGTVNGNRLSFTLTQNNLSCPGSFSGIATVVADAMTFTYTGNDCLGSHTNGRGSATRQ